MGFVLPNPHPTITVQLSSGIGHITAIARSRQRVRRNKTIKRVELHIELSILLLHAWFPRIEVTTIASHRTKEPDRGIRFRTPTHHPLLDSARTHSAGRLLIPTAVGAVKSTLKGKLAARGFQSVPGRVRSPGRLFFLVVCSVHHEAGSLKQPRRSSKTNQPARRACGVRCVSWCSGDW